MKIVFLILGTVILGSCHSVNTNDEIIIIKDTIKVSEGPITTSVFDKTKVVDTLKK